MQKKITISFIGNSIKFVKVFKSIYPNSTSKCYSWWLLGNILAEQKIKFRSDVVVICGYDYSSQWYLYQKYYNYNVVYPLKFAKTISKNKTKIFYIDTINKITKIKNSKKRYTLSRYEFAKKELRTKLLRNFKLIKILTLPVLINNNKADVHGGFFTKIIYNLLIKLNYIKIIDLKNLKKLVIQRNSNNKKDETITLVPLALSIPRSLFFDRFLRFLND